MLLSMNGHVTSELDAHPSPESTTTLPLKVGDTCTLSDPARFPTMDVMEFLTQMAAGLSNMSIDSDSNPKARNVQ